MRRKGEEKEMERKEYEVITKIATYDGMYYTLNKHTRDEVKEIKDCREKECTIEYSEDEIKDELVREDLCRIITSATDLIWLPYENKIINRKEIKESFIQIA